MYKAGDTLMCHDASGTLNRLLQFSAYTVKMALAGGTEVELLGVVGVWCCTRFALVSPATQPPLFIAKEYTGKKEDLKPGQVYIEGYGEGIRVIKQQPSVHCRCCHLKAPFKLVDKPHPGNMLGLQPQMIPDLTGWMVIDFPYKDPYHAVRHEGVDSRTQFVKKTKLCPKCAQTVMGTLVHIETNGVKR